MDHRSTCPCCYTSASRPPTEIYAELDLVSPIKKIQEAIDTYMRDRFVCILSKLGYDWRPVSGYGASTYRDGHLVGEISRTKSTCIKQSIGCDREVSR